MPIFLCIETSQSKASVALIKDGICVKEVITVQQKEQASFLQPAIKDTLDEAGMSVSEIDAVAVSIGPGSYTGLRVGLASAKGICFAINKPLITINTLKMMAYSSRFMMHDHHEFFLAPMIDARRNEVFTAVYDQNLTTCMKPQALILSEASYIEFADQKICFFGDGSVKWQDQCKISNAIFSELSFSASDMNALTMEAYIGQIFAPLSSAVPFYGKDFYSTMPRN